MDRTASADKPTLDDAVEVDNSSDADSVLSEDRSSYTASLRSSLLQAVNENGRAYHRFRDGQYILPEDQDERDRLDMQHDMFLRTFGGNLYLAPLEEQNLREALDLGTGTGIWAVDFADQHPGVNILGVDLSPMQASYAPPNCRWEIDDYEYDWNYKQKFDYIHGRMMLTSVADFPKLFKQAYTFLQPGGWLELQELQMPWRADDESMKGTALQEWNDTFIYACNKVGRDCTQASRYKDWMTEFGFEEVHEAVYKWPIGTWAKDPALKELGKYNLINTLEGIEGFTTRLFTKALSMRIEEVQAHLADVRKDLYNKNIHCYWPIYVVYGRKPHQRPAAES